MRREEAGSCWCRWSETPCASVDVAAGRIDVEPGLPWGGIRGDRHLHAVPGVVSSGSTPSAMSRNALAAGSRAGVRGHPRAHPAHRRPGRRHAVRRRGGNGAARGRDGRCATCSLRRSIQSSCASSRRVIALTPSGRMLDDDYVNRACGGVGTDAAVRPLRGLRRADRRALRQRDAVDRALRALRRRALRRWSYATRCCASCRAHSATTDSAVEESFSEALGGEPEYPHYTRPAEYRGWRVPEVLLSGHHERIGSWRRERSRERAGGLGRLADRAGRRP